jgi:hypothetical protein
MIGEDDVPSRGHDPDVVLPIKKSKYAEAVGCVLRIKLGTVFKLASFVMDPNSCWDGSAWLWGFRSVWSSSQYSHHVRALEPSYEGTPLFQGRGTNQQWYPQESTASTLGQSNDPEDIRNQKDN